MATTAEDNVVFPTRPPALTISKTCIYKVVGNIKIPIDIYLPATTSDDLHPIMLFIHGGGWTGSNRSDYCRPLFRRFLSLNFVVASMDYRLVPESSFACQLKDIESVEHWLRFKLEDEIQGIKAGKKGADDPEDGIDDVANQTEKLDVDRKHNADSEKNVIGDSDDIVTSNGHGRRKVDVDKIVLVGSSAGAHLALLTPKIWTHPPTCILSLYGPTDLFNVPYIGGGRLSELPVPEPTHELLKLATDFSCPPTSTPVPVMFSDYLKPRSLMSLNIFRSGTIPEFLIRGLLRDPVTNQLSLPPKGSVSQQEIEEISPIHVARKVPFPPVYQVIGNQDKIFAEEHVINLDEVLREKEGGEGRSQFVVVDGVGHAFDNWVGEGEELDQGVMAAAVEWVVGWVGVEVD